MPIFQQPSAAMPPMPGGLYGGPEYPQGGGELRKVAEIALNYEINESYVVKKHTNGHCLKIPRGISK